MNSKEYKNLSLAVQEFVKYRCELGYITPLDEEFLDVLDYIRRENKNYCNEMKQLLIYPRYNLTKANSILVEILNFCAIHCIESICYEPKYSESWSTNEIKAHVIDEEVKKSGIFIRYKYYEFDITGLINI